MCLICVALYCVIVELGQRCCVWGWQSRSWQRSDQSNGGSTTQSRTGFDAISDAKVSGDFQKEVASVFGTVYPIQLVLHVPHTFKVLMLSNSFDIRSPS